MKHWGRRGGDADTNSNGEPGTRAVVADGNSLEPTALPAVSARIALPALKARSLGSVRPSPANNKEIA